MRRVRCVPAAAEGLCGGRCRRPREVSGPMNWPYAVKEIFYTLQGEGAQCRDAPRCSAALPDATSGAGGRQDRAQRQSCNFCDTDFVGTDGDGGGKFGRRESLAAAVARHWPGIDADIGSSCAPAASRCCSSMRALIDALHAREFRDCDRDQWDDRGPGGRRLGLREPEGRSGSLRSTAGDELKLVYPQGIDPNEYATLALRTLLHSTDGWTGRRSLAGCGDSVLPGPSSVAAESADAQADRDSLSL